MIQTSESTQEVDQEVDCELNSNKRHIRWNKVLPQWQLCLEEAWTSYCKGSLPIGAVVTDSNGNLIGRGRNRIYEDDIYGEEREKQILCGHRLAHAEMNALLQVNWKEVDPKECVLYTTTEPCPLCVGAIRLARIRTVYYASKDTGAGSANLFTANEFMQRAKIQVTGPNNDAMATILTAMLAEIILRREDENMSLLFDVIEQEHPVGAKIGKTLFEKDLLHLWRKQKLSIGYVYDKILALVCQTDAQTNSANLNTI